MFGFIGKMLSELRESHRQKRLIKRLSAELGYTNTILRIHEVEVMHQAWLAFAVSAEPAWPSEDLHQAGMLVRAWISRYLVWIPAKLPGLHCAAETSGGNRTTIIHGVRVELPLWVLWDSKGEIGPLQVLYTHDPEHNCLYIQIGAVLMSAHTYGDPNCFRLLGRLGEAFERHCSRFSLVRGVSIW